MASVYNFTFDNLTGLNDDSCSISEKEVQKYKETGAPLWGLP